MSSQILNHLQEARVLIVRHARSHFNNDFPHIKLDDKGKKIYNNLDEKGTKIYTDDHHKFSRNPSYIDCLLCDEGI